MNFSNNNKFVCQSLNSPTQCRSENSSTSADYHFRGELGPPRGALKSTHLARMLSGGVSYTRCGCMGNCTTRQCTCISAGIRCTSKCHVRHNLNCQNGIKRRRIYVYPRALDRNVVHRPHQGGVPRGMTYDKCNCRNNRCTFRCPCVRSGRYCFLNCHPNSAVCNNFMISLRGLGRRYSFTYPRCNCRIRCNNRCRCDRSNKWCHDNCHLGRICRN